MTGTQHFPQPIFEGAEKRLELDFALKQWSIGAATAAEGGQGLRSLSSDEWNRLLEPAQCCIVSGVSNTVCDAYLLSESSLFVYDTKVILKTCGTTKILDSVPGLVLAAGKLNLRLKRAKYSRSTFKCPEQQPAPHTNFSLETAALDDLFGHLGSGGHAYTLGDQLKNALWHIYTAGEEEANYGDDCEKERSEEQQLEEKSASCRESTVSLEICMTGLDAKYCEQFSCNSCKGNSERLRFESGIAKMVVSHDKVDDYVFDPCGYSLNAVKGDALVTIHVTPEENFSYASMEFSGIRSTTSSELDRKKMVQYVSELFNPSCMYVATTFDGLRSRVECRDLSLEKNLLEAAAAAAPLRNYKKLFSTDQVLTSYGECSFQAFVSCPGNASYSDHSLVVKVEKPSSPVTVLGEGDQESPLAFMDLSPSQCIKEIMPKHSNSAPGTMNGDGTFVSKYVKAEAIEAATWVDEYAASKIIELGLEDTFYMFDLGNVYRRVKTWKKLLPRVQPFYAVKCNPDAGILSTLAALGTGFDCASQMELDSVLNLGVTPDRVVYANACKRPSDLRHMQCTDTFLTTFDSESELLKIKAYHPRADVLLRIRADDPNARCYLGNKYGAEMCEVDHLLKKATELGLHIVGVSFHVGSGASDPNAFRMAITLARSVFDMASNMGISTMNLLDIGGGFSGGTGDGMKALLDVSQVINSTLEEHFPREFGYRIIAEPGRYFSEGACSLYTCVYGKRERSVGGKQQNEYWLTDGLYGSMNCVIYDHATLTAKPLKIASSLKLGAKCCDDGEPVEVEESYSSTLFGPTCDGLDTVMKDVLLPKLSNGDWIAFPAMGAYTISASSNFNGILASAPSIFYVVSKGE